MLTYTPAANYNGSDSFVVSVGDGRGASSQATVTINIAAVNDDPVAVNDNAGSVPAGQTLTIPVRANDSDVDGDTLTVTSATGATRGALSISGGAVLYTAGFSAGTDSFTYTISDGNGGTASASVTVTVTANTFGSWLANKFTAAEQANAAISGDLADPDGDGLSNLLEYAFGAEPKGVSASAGPQLGFSSGHLTLSFTREAANTDLTYTAQAADTPAGPWSDLATSSGGTAMSVVTGGTAVSETGAGTQKSVIVTDPVVTGDPLRPQRFLRLKVRR